MENVFSLLNRLKTMGNSKWNVIGLEAAELIEKQQQEIIELRAQLARCVDALNEIIRPRTLDEWDRFDRTDFVTSVIDSLPQQAKFDAEVLRCSYRISEDYFFGNDDINAMLNNSKIISELTNAVRAAKEDK